MDVSQLEPATALAGPLLLDRSVNGRSARRSDFPTGNRRGGRAAGRVPRRAGDDKWVVISCRTEPEWRSFVKAVEHPEWATDPRFDTLAQRRRHADALDALVEQWTSTRDRYEVMDLLQAARVPAGAVQDAADRLERDPQLAARHHFVPLVNDRGGGAAARRGAVRSVGHAARRPEGASHRGPPDIDEDGDDILGDLLDLDDAAIAESARRGGPAVSPAEGRGALSGVRVVELVDEPVDYCGRLLAGLGADVIVVEPPEGSLPAPRGSVRRGSRGRPRCQPGLVALQRGQAVGRDRRRRGPGSSDRDRRRRRAHARARRRRSPVASITTRSPRTTRR